jgi:hypothetical protein
MEIVKDDNESSTRIINILKYIIRIDGSSKYDDERLSIYYNPTYDDETNTWTYGNYIDGFDNDSTKLNQLTILGLHDFFIKYVDDSDNYSYYYISIYVEDTIAPVITSDVSDSTKLTITTSNEGVSIDMVSVSATDNYSEASKLTCTFTLGYLTFTSSEYECDKDSEIEVDENVIARYENKIFKFSYIGTYNLTYTFTDENGNYNTKTFEIVVDDDTPVEYVITPNYDEIEINDNTINLGTYNYDLISSEGISLASLATITLTENNELNSTYTMANNAIFTSSKLGNTNIEIEGIESALFGDYYIKLNVIGTYTITYTVTNASSKSITIIYTLTVVDTEKPIITISKDNEETNETSFIINVEENNSKTLLELRDDTLNRISITYSDNYNNETYLNNKATSSCVLDSNINATNKYLATYKCTYKVSDESNNITTKDIVIIIRDLIQPSININSGKYYINVDTVTLELPTCSDNYSNNCNVYYKVNNGSETKYNNRKVTINGLQAGSNTIEIYARDTVGNESTHYTYTYVVDKISPVINVIKSNTELDDYYTCEIAGNEDKCVFDNNSTYYILKDDEYTFIHLEIVEDNLNSLALSKYDGSLFVEITFSDISESGLYQVVVSDKSNNMTSKEFYVYKEIHNESNNNVISVVTTTNGDTETSELEYRELQFVEYNKNTQAIVYQNEAFSKIEKTDGVYLVGMNSNNEYVKLYKYNGSDLYNTVTNVKANSAGISDSLINIDGTNYLMMVLVDNDATVANTNGETTSTSLDSSNNLDSDNSYSWIFYMLGVIGLLGGGLLIVKLRNKIRAA